MPKTKTKPGKLRAFAVWYVKADLSRVADLVADGQFYIQVGEDSDNSIHADEVASGAGINLTVHVLPGGFCEVRLEGGDFASAPVLSPSCVDDETTHEAPFDTARDLRGEPADWGSKPHLPSPAGALVSAPDQNDFIRRVIGRLADKKAAGNLCAWEEDYLTEGRALLAKAAGVQPEEPAGKVRP